jgi:two-component system phosphate regulon sensor histidine kinase PhoR
MRRIRLIWLIFPAFLLVTLVSLVAVTWYAARSWREFYLQETSHDLTIRARLMEGQIKGWFSPEAGARINQVCKEVGKITGTRYTVILPSGKVLGDSEEDPTRMDNHRDRPEVQEALQGRVGVATRYSSTLKHHMMYVAVPLQIHDQTEALVRAALPMTSIVQALGGLYLKIAMGAGGIALFVTILSLILAGRLSSPLEDLKRGARRFAGGDLSRKLPISGTDELASLAEALNHMAEQLEDQIHTLRQQQQEQEAILSSMAEGVMAVDTEGRLINLNRAGAQMLGVSAESVQNLAIQEVVRDRDLQWFMTRTLSSEKSIEGEVALKTNGQRIMQVLGTSLRDSTGIAMGTLIVFHDITHLRRLERTRRDFVANVSHELKTPVTSIKGFVETLLAGALKETENAENFLRIIGKQTDRLNEIIEDLLTLARIEQDAERGQIFLTAQKIKDILQEAVQVCEAKAAEKAVAIQLNCPEDLRAHINAPLLEQALVNLIDNAIKYSGEGSMVQMEAVRVEPEVEIRVKDQGLGIAKEHLERIFERFYRVDASRNRKAGGSGLGLAIVKHIAQAHGGKIQVESSPGKGSTFSLHLLAAS